MKVGGRVKGIAGWEEVVERVKRKLRSWDSKTLSIGGRVTLINSVIATIPIYRLSFNHLPKAVANQLRSLQCNFLWGGNEGSRKKAWIKWDIICREKKAGGLGIRNPMIVNRVMLLKWVWRFLGEEERLWTRVIISRHGFISCGREAIQLNSRGGSRSGWWGKVVDLAAGDLGKWFREKLVMKLGDGKSANFWKGAWSGKQTVQEKFPRLFQLSENKDGKVAEMGSWVEGSWRWEIAWRRELLEREKGVAEELLNFLGNFRIMEGVPDRWLWGGEENRSFSAKEAYKAESEFFCGPSELSERGGEFRAVWKVNAPLKAQLMGWRLFWNRLPTKDNISKIFVIPVEDRRCCGCKMEIESAGHLFFHCEEASSLWNKIVDWVGIRWAPPRRVGDHFVEFSHLLDGKERRRRLGGLWICVVWVVWKWRNAVIFEGKQWDWKRIEVEIRCRFWSWCLVKGKAIHDVSYGDWSSTKLCVAWERL